MLFFDSGGLAAVEHWFWLMKLNMALKNLMPGLSGLRLPL